VNTKDLSKITLAEVLHALQGIRAMKIYERRSCCWRCTSSQKQWEYNKKPKQRKGKKIYPPCQYCEKLGHLPFRCWKRPDVKCTKCNQIGHEAVICRANIQRVVADAENAQEDEDQLFFATCFSSSNSSESWLIDSGCTNHMTYDRDCSCVWTTPKKNRSKLGIMDKF